MTRASHRALREAVERDGYAVIRNLLQPEEIARLRDSLRAHFERSGRIEGLGLHQPGASTSIPDIEWVFAHQGILDAMKGIARSDHLVFTGNADAHRNMLSWWHKDTDEARGGCLPGDYWSAREVGVYRAGIYLQDHHEDGHGLKVRPRSHRTRSPHEGVVEVLDTRAGDVVFFDIRLSHAGQLPDPVEYALLRVGRFLRTPSPARAMKEVWGRALRKPSKMSLFATYGAPGANTWHYCEHEAKARSRRERGHPSLLPPHLVRVLREQGVDCNPALCDATLGVATIEPDTGPVEVGPG